MLYTASALFLLFLISMVFYKYTIDTKITITELRKDRDIYRNKLWVLIKRGDKLKEEFIVANSSNTLYKNLKQKISLLRNDLAETDFENYENIKDEILKALKDIDSYGEGNDKSKN
jgi:hypothetical protein